MPVHEGGGPPMSLGQRAPWARSRRKADPPLSSGTFPCRARSRRKADPPMTGQATGVLGISTSGEACRVAFGVVSGRPRDLASALAAARWREAEDRRGHAERIFSLLDRILGCPGLSRVGLVAVSGGPGSFTGLRVGMAVAKAFARFGKIPLVAVPTLEAMAAEAALRARRPEGVMRGGQGRRGLAPLGRARAALYVPFIDAKRGEVYAAFFKPGRGGVVQVGKPAVREPTALKAGLPAGAVVVEEPARARTVAALGFLAFAVGRRADPDRLVPAYVRRPEAVEKMRAGLLKRPRRRRSGRHA